MLKIFYCWLTNDYELKNLLYASVMERQIYQKPFERMPNAYTYPVAREDVFNWIERKLLGNIEFQLADTSILIDHSAVQKNIRMDKLRQIQEARKSKLEEQFGNL